MFYDKIVHETGDALSSWTPATAAAILHLASYYRLLVWVRGLTPICLTLGDMCDDRWIQCYHQCSLERCGLTRGMVLNKNTGLLSPSQYVWKKSSHTEHSLDFHWEFIDTITENTRKVIILFRLRFWESFVWVCHVIGPNWWRRRFDPVWDFRGGIGRERMVQFFH